MKAHLMYSDRDFDAGREEPVNADDLIQDLELDTLWEAMARGDGLIRAVARTAVLASLSNVAEIRYRQNVLSDCLRQPGVVRGLYDLAADAIAGEKNIFRTFFIDRPSALLDRSVSVLQQFVKDLRRLEQVGREAAGGFGSEGFTRFFSMVGTELDEEYFAVVERHLKQLRFHEGLLMSARLNDGNRGTDYVLREPRQENRDFFNRVGLKKPRFSLTIPERDESGFRALSELRDRGLNAVADAAAQSADHVLAFFHALRRELAFYIGCLNLYEQLASQGESVCFPLPSATEQRALSARNLYEPCLSLRIGARVAANDLDADGTSLIMITGANQGGKSTFLRSLGVAHLMMQSGMFVAAESFAASCTRGLFTHYKREEDATMASGKLDEELNRMSDIADHIGSGCLLLCNESFAATNEREGSQIAGEVTRAMTDGEVRVCFVTHLFDLAHRFYEEHLQTALFLRAERHSGGERTFRVEEGEPRPTSYGKDLYDRIFGTPSLAPTTTAAVAPPAPGKHIARDYGRS